MDDKLRAGPLLSNALRDLWRPPFALLTVLNLLIYFALSSVSTVDGGGAFGTLLLAVLSAFVQVAMTLAAGGDTSERSADAWIKRAFRRGAFWRFILTGLLMVTIVVFGFLFLIVGGFVAGAMVGLAQPASVQERLWPFAAIRRSIQLSEGARSVVGLVFALLYTIPTFVVQIGFSLGWDQQLGIAWVAAGAVTTVLSSAGVIALTRAYVALGGAPTPLEEKQISRAR